MRPIVPVFVAVVTLLGASLPARGQSAEVSGLVGYTPAVGLANRAPELSSLDIGHGFTWGLQAAWLLTRRWGFEVLWTDQAFETDG